MKLLIIRHGQCEANVQGIVAGSSIDSPLTPAGEAEALQAGQTLAGRQIDQILASPLTRARQTAQIIRQAAGLSALPIIIEPGIIERDSGAANGTDRVKYLADLQAGVVIPGAESLEQLFNRAKVVIDSLDRSLDCVMMVTHGGTARAIESVVTGQTAEAIRFVIDMQNAEIRELELA